MLRIPSGGAFAALLYLLFSLLDLAFSVLAFHLGFQELNPLLRWLAQHSLFIPAKLVMTAGIAMLVAYLYRSAAARLVAWSGVVVMAAVTAYHILGLSAAL